MDLTLAFVIKGVAALLGLGLLLTHMLTTEEDMTVARALRYVALLLAAGAVAFASQEQVREGVDWRSRQWGGLVVAFSIIICSIASLWEDHLARKDK